MWVILAAATTLMMSACGSTANEAEVERSSTPSRSAAVPCGNPEGGSCINELTAGRTYRTTKFEPRISYSVADAGWSNQEDLPGNFLLLPPGNDLAGVNAATSDFVGVYSSITASRFSSLDGCETEPLADVPRTPAGFVTWLQSQPVLDVSRPQPVTISGLTGLMTDVRIAPGKTPTTCTIDADKITVALLFSGLDPSSLDHGVVPNMTMRLYLLQRGDRLMVVEVDDIDSAPGDLDSLSAEVARLQFAG